MENSQTNRLLVDEPELTAPLELKSVVILHFVFPLNNHWINLGTWARWVTVSPENTGVGTVCILSPTQTFVFSEIRRRIKWKRRQYFAVEQSVFNIVEYCQGTDCSKTEILGEALWPALDEADIVGDQSQHPFPTPLSFVYFCHGE